MYPSVKPGYHQNKMHWNTIILDGSVPEKDIKMMIDESYDLISDSPTKRIYDAVKKIPEGKVATYEQKEKMAGNPNEHASSTRFTDIAKVTIPTIERIRLSSFTIFSLS